jgi:hypothetical protein
MPNFVTVIQLENLGMVTIHNVVYVIVRKYWILMSEHNGMIYICTYDTKYLPTYIHMYIQECFVCSKDATSGSSHVMIVSKKIEFLYLYIFSIKNIPSQPIPWYKKVKFTRNLTLQKVTKAPIEICLCNYINIGRLTGKNSWLANKSRTENYFPFCRFAWNYQKSTTEVTQINANEWDFQQALAWVKTSDLNSCAKSVQEFPEWPPQPIFAKSDISFDLNSCLCTPLQRRTYNLSIQVFRNDYQDSYLEETLHVVPPPPTRRKKFDLTCIN